MSTSFNDYKKVHFNVPQLMFHILKSRINVLIWGRGTGKTNGPIADFALDNMTRMIGSNGAFVGTSYEQLLTRTLPGWIKGMQALGYTLNTHFFVRRFPPDKFKWVLPEGHPLKPDHYITVHISKKRCSGIYLLSQDRAGMSNGLSTAWIAGDEAKFLNFEQLKQEVLLTLRGYDHLYGHLPNCRSVLFCSDMPTTKEGEWLLEFENFMDEEVMEILLSIYHKMVLIKHQLMQAQAENDINSTTYYANELERYQKEIDAIKIDETYYSTATTLDNVHVLGIDAIKSFKRYLTAYEYQTSVLTMKVRPTEEQFYYGIAQKHMKSFASNIELLDRLVITGEAIEKDCRWDMDMDSHLPLEIAADYGANFNCVVVGQEYDDEFRILNALHVYSPDRIKDLVQKFCRYYRFKERKEVIFYYDHTAKGRDAIRAEDITYLSEWVNNLIAEGWNVEAVFIGQAKEHKTRYLMWQRVFDKEDHEMLKVTFNSERCKQLLTCMENTNIKISASEGLKKNKDDERKKLVDQATTTHYPDAIDTLIGAKVEGHGIDISADETGAY